MHFSALKAAEFTRTTPRHLHMYVVTAQFVRIVQSVRSYQEAAEALSWIVDGNPLGATVRRLPPRREAIQYASDNGLITDEEYAGAIPEPKKPKRIDFWTGEDEGTEEPTAKEGDFESDKLKYFAGLDEQLADLE